jgi:hypothetical protein
MSNRWQRRAAASEARKRGSWEWVQLPIDPALFERYPAVQNVRAAYRNDFWIVQVYEFTCALGPMLHLAIRSVAQAGTRSGVEPSWSELQRIKNELCSDIAEAVQVHPRDKDLTDQADMYHLFVLPRGWPLPFGLHRENGLAPRRVRVEVS